MPLFSTGTNFLASRSLPYLGPARQFFKKWYPFSCPDSVNPCPNPDTVVQMVFLGLSNAELTALLTLDDFDDTTVFPGPKSTQELYTLLRSFLEDREQCELLRNKWRTFKTFLPKVADDRLVKRTKMFTPGTGQNQCNAVERVSKEAEHAEMFKRMERWTMTFWALAPRTVMKYLSFENQGRQLQTNYSSV